MKREAVSLLRRSAQSTCRHDSTVATEKVVSIIRDDDGRWRVKPGADRKRVVIVCIFFMRKSD